jgi:hypothetical protein
MEEWLEKQGSKTRIKVTWEGLGEKVSLKIQRNRSKRIQPQPFMNESDMEFHHRLKQLEQEDNSSDYDTGNDPDAVSEKTIQREMRIRGWHFCIACQKIWLSWGTVQARLKFGREYIKMEIDFWRKVRFTDECHLSLGPQGKVSLLRQRGER